MERILITGNMRSGTTFLANFLNSQEGITIFRDSFHSLAGKMLGSPTKLLKLDYSQPINDNEKKYLLEKIHYGFKMLGNIVSYKLKLNLNDFDTIGELYNIILDSISKDGDVVVGHKVTECELNIENIVTQTDVKVIYIMRDPRDVVMSSVKKFKQPLNHYLAGWKRRVDLVEEAMDNPLCIDKILFVKYEDLICNSQALRDKLSDFLGVPITYDLKVLKDFNNDWNNNSSYGDIKNLYDENAVYRWKKNFTEDVKYIQDETLDYLSRFGYDLEFYAEDEEQEDEILNVDSELLSDGECGMIGEDEILNYIEEMNSKLESMIEENKCVIEKIKNSNKE